MMKVPAAPTAKGKPAPEIDPAWLQMAAAQMAAQKEKAK